MKVLVLKTVEGYYHETKMGDDMCQISCCYRREPRYSQLHNESQREVSRWNTTKKVALAVTGVFFAAGIIAGAVVINQSGPPYHTNLELMIGGGFLTAAALSGFLGAYAEGRESRARGQLLAQQPPEA